ncbi:putative glycerol uptake facilitator protein [Neolewinella maritima]|uniref:Glycerol uptake facilitator protein n=1 Tax=Neolewinella maritima TaxID=1383882 RepID=A0ABM9B308_9BACT|nr:MIP/aquaporin family protein [Neolewinella maritima]CAH1001558.1 putative glycerol uptake facilitator protein [Neolewinella maritima]
MLTPELVSYLGELLGTAILILLGNGVVANMLLAKTKGNGNGLMPIAVAWAVAVFVGVFVTAPMSGAHLNPAVTLGLAVVGKFSWLLVPGYVVAQIAGAFLGQALVVLSYRDHYAATEDTGLVLATFSTDPAIPNHLSNILTEAIGTFVLVFAVLYITGPKFGDAPGSLGALDALPVALVVLGIGLSLGGPTGYAINPARDLGPRIAHALLPLANKGGSNWAYSWVPVVGPIIGALVAAGLWHVVPVAL